MHTRSSSPRDPTRPPALGFLLLAACGLPSVAHAIPPPELAAAVVSDLLLLLGVVASAGFTWLFAVRPDDADGPARRAWRQLSGVVAVSILVSGALVLQHRTVDRRRAHAPLFRDVDALPLPDDDRLPPTAVGPTELRALLRLPEPPLLVDIRPGGGFADTAPSLDELVPGPVLRRTFAELRDDPSPLVGRDPAPILICWTGETSAGLARELTDRGIPTRYVAGGITHAIDEPEPLRVVYEDQHWIRSPADAAALLASGHRAIAAGDTPHLGHSVAGAVALSALTMAPDELAARIAELPREAPWIGLCHDRRSCYDAELLGAWMSEAGHTWRGLATDPGEVLDRLRRPRRRLGGEALTLAGVGLFLIGALRRRRRAPSNRAIPLHEADRSAGAKAWALASLSRAGIRVPAGLVIGPEAPTPRPSDLALLGDRLAVRSSAPDEDRPTSSAAGRYVTVLDVDPADADAAVEAVRASMPGGAVLIQPMIASEAGGVLFTRAPDRPAFLAVEWADRADAVTSGLEATRALLSRLDGRVVEGRLPPQVEGGALVRLGRRLEDLMGAPQDVEWCLGPEGLVVLQTRAITASPAVPAFEVERGRVLDGVPRGADPEGVRWTQERVSEALPRPTPLALDLLRDVWGRDGAMGRAQQALGQATERSLFDAPERLDREHRLQSVFGALVVVRPEAEKPPTPQRTPPLPVARLERALAPALTRLTKRPARDALAGLSVDEHARIVLRWWRQLAREDHLALAMISLAAEQWSRADGIPTIPARSRRSLLDLTVGPSPDPPPLPPLDADQPLASLLHLREAVRAHVQRATDPLRRELSALDSRLGLEGTIAWLRNGELLAAVRDPEGYRALARQRARDAAEVGAPLLPVRLTPRDVEDLGTPGTARPDGGRWLTTPAVVTGRVRRLTDPRELPALLPGEVLVVPVAEVGWIAALGRAAAVVVQVGGALSHLAIVAREQQVPLLAVDEGLGGLVTGDPVALGPNGLRVLRGEDRR